MKKNYAEENNWRTDIDRYKWVEPTIGNYLYKIQPPQGHWQEC